MPCVLWVIELTLSLRATKYKTRLWSIHVCWCLGQDIRSHGVAFDEDQFQIICAISACKDDLKCRYAFILLQTLLTRNGLIVFEPYTTDSEAHRRLNCLGAPSAQRPFNEEFSCVCIASVGQTTGVTLLSSSIQYIYYFSQNNLYCFLVGCIVHIWKALPYFCCGDTYRWKTLNVWQVYLQQQRCPLQRKVASSRISWHIECCPKA